MERNPRRIITTGTPGWTLLSTLRMFGRVRELVPDAELVAFLDGPAKVPKEDNPQFVQVHRNVMQEIAKLSTQPGVTVFNHPAQPEDFEQAAIWLYPAHIEEIYVRGAILAQRHGAIPFFNPIGALTRDIFAGNLLQGFAYSDRLTLARYTYELVRWLSNDLGQERIRAAMIAKAIEVEAAPSIEPIPWPKVHEIVTQAEDIPGWMTRAELVWLVQHAAKMESVVEIGSFKGRSTFAMLSVCPGTVTAVDHWKGGGALEPAWLNKLHAENDLHATFLENVGKFDNLRVLKCSSIDGSLRVKSTEMAFIDADHGYQACREDIRAWLPRTTRLLCGHDYNWPTVRAAVEDELGGAECGPGDIWFKWVDVKEGMANAAD